MTCSFCGSRHHEGEHRCRLCGRRPNDTLTGDHTLMRTEGALATQMQPEIRFHDADQEPLAKPIGRAVQRALFPDRESKIIPFDAYSPDGLAKPRSNTKPRAAVKPRSTATAPKTSSRRSVHESQTKLDFLPPETSKAKMLTTTVEAVILSDAPVATAQHRAVAAALDAAMVLVGYGIFVIAYFSLGGEFSLNRATLMSFGAALLLIAAAYGLMWTLAGVDSAGMRWTGLRLSTFDGFPVERKRRVWRFLGSCLSFATVVGQLWCLADEECLNWQDHISGTYPTPCEANSQVFRRM